MDALDSPPRRGASGSIVKARVLTIVMLQRVRAEPERTCSAMPNDRVMPTPEVTTTASTPWAGEMTWNVCSGCLA